MAIHQSFLGEFDHELSITRKVLSRIPAEQFGFQPHEKSMTLGKLASHIADMYGWGTATLKTDSLDLAPIDGPKWEQFDAQSPAELLAKLDENAAAFRSALAEASDDAAWMAPWSLLMAGNPVMTMPRVACVRGMVMNHIVHHRAQAALYLRLLDIPVPAMYGPSADEQH